MSSNPNPSRETAPLKTTNRYFPPRCFLHLLYTVIWWRKYWPLNSSFLLVSLGKRIRVGNPVISTEFTSFWVASILATTFSGLQAKEYLLTGKHDNMSFQRVLINRKTRQYVLPKSTYLQENTTICLSKEYLLTGKHDKLSFQRVLINRKTRQIVFPKSTYLQENTENYLSKEYLLTWKHDKLSFQRVLINRKTRQYVFPKSTY